jgi:cysteine desulfurase
VHTVGRAARAQVEAARAQVGALMGARPADVIFTSGGTESNNLALSSLMAEADALITSRLEHPSVIRWAERLEREGKRVCWIPVGPLGAVEPFVVGDVVREQSDPRAVVVALQAVNHETGVIQPVEQVVELVRRLGARIHVDAVQAVGRVHGRSWAEADTVAMASHKIRGPKGIGALITSSCARLRPLLVGGSQEKGLRPGTVSAALAAGLRVAAEWAGASPSRYDRLSVLRDRLEATLVAHGGEVNGTARRVPHVVNVSFEAVRGDELVVALDVEGVCVSSGSACSAGTPEASAVIAAMGGSGRAAGALRVSLGDSTTADDVEYAIGAIRRVFSRLPNG